MTTQVVLQSQNHRLQSLLKLAHRIKPNLDLRGVIYAIAWNIREFTERGFGFRIASRRAIRSRIRGLNWVQRSEAFPLSAFGFKAIH